MNAEYHARKCLELLEGDSSISSTHALMNIAWPIYQIDNLLKERLKKDDTNERETFATGAVRDTAVGKPRPDLISPLAMDRLGHWLCLGAQKYRPRNWEAGISVERCFASLYRHLLKYQEGDSTEDHLAAVFCNAMFILHFEEAVKRGLLPESLLDMPSYQKEKD